MPTTTTMKPLTLIGCGLMFLSTCLLYPGLCGILVKWKISLKVFGTDLTIIDEDRTFVGMMLQMTAHEAFIPALLLTFFGFVLPLIKIVLFVLWVIHHIDDSRQPARAASSAQSSQEASVPEESPVHDKYIRMVKGLSKWTAVDAVCECLVVGMLLNMPSTNGEHGLGFFCFVAYVVTSSIAFLCLPGEVGFAEEPPNNFHMRIVDKLKCSKTRKATLAISLVTFLVVLSLSGTAASMKLWIPKDEIQVRVGRKLLNRDNVPPPLRGLTDAALRRIEEAIANLVDLEVVGSLAGCIRRLFASDSWYTLIGSFVMLTCVVFLPVVYAVINAAYALALTELPEEELKCMTDRGNRGEIASPWPSMCRMRACLWDLSMLDVCAVALPIAAGAPFHVLDGDLLPGYGLLVTAAILWHVHNFLCRAAQLSVLVDVDQQLLLPSDPQPEVAKSSLSQEPIYI